MDVLKELANPHPIEGKPWLKIIGAYRTPDRFAIVATCVTCKKGSSLTLNVDSFRAWLYGKKFVQDEFPHLSVDDRELLISGICGPCFDRMFDEEEREEKE